MVRLLIAVMACCFIAAPAAAQSSQSSRAVDALFGRMADNEPGAVVLVMRGDETLYLKAFGAADLEQRQPITPDTRFHVASVSKQFTALAIVLLAREKRLSLDDDVRQYLPDLPKFGTKITVADLLQHTSGLRDQWDLVAVSGTDMQGLIRQDALLGLITAQQELNFTPRSEYRYSNSGYTLAAEIVARVSGVPFRQFVQDRIFKPLGMGNSLIYDNAAELIPGRAQSYGRGSSGLVELRRLNYSNYGATSMFSTAADLQKWAREILRPRVFDAALIASLHQGTRLTDGTRSNYGLGVYKGEVRGHTAIMHGGSDAGFRALTASYPGANLSIVILSNGSADMGQLNEGLVDVFLKRRAKQASIIEPRADELARLAGYYASGWGPGLQLKVEGNHLVRAAGAPPGRATFRSDGTIEFSAPTMRMKVLGKRDAPAAALEDQPVNGPAVRYERIERMPVSPTDLHTVAGRYYSSALDITFTLAVRDDRLTLSNLQNPKPLLLTPIRQDWYDGPSFRLTVLRNVDGRPHAIRITTGRARNLKFEKVS